MICFVLQASQIQKFTEKNDPKNTFSTDRTAFDCVWKVQFDMSVLPHLHSSTKHAIKRYFGGFKHNDSWTERRNISDRALSCHTSLFLECTFGQFIASVKFSPILGLLNCCLILDPRLGHRLYRGDLRPSPIPFLVWWDHYIFCP